MTGDLKPRNRSSAFSACKHAFYKTLKVEPTGVECPQSWNSEATAVSIVEAEAA